MNYFKSFHKTNNDMLISPLDSGMLSGVMVRAAVLRLDLMDKEINGNKWFKLKYQLEDALQLGCTTIVTYGGVWSNHIHAAAAACKQFGLKSRAYIRSDESLITEMIFDAKKNGMDIVYLSRSAYQQFKNKQGQDPDNKAEYFIPEGGSTGLGIKGAEEILNITSLASYTHILCAIGTGTTFAGLVKASCSHQTVIGVPVLNWNTIDLEKIINVTGNKNIILLKDFHFGGFGKISDALLEFMNAWQEATKIPTDRIYTGKMFYAFKYGLLPKLEPGSNVLIIHTGGLQGNRSLAKGILRF